jgi:uncharacterized protein DUF87
MGKIVIGQIVGTDKPLKLDLDLVLTSRLLIQANSGGGKSYLLRRLAELSFGKVQTIIIDPEGEFFTLREKFGYVLVGQGGETPCDVRSAAMLAQRFLELRCSAVVDMFEAFRGRPLEARRWVRDFINALLDAPRALWHPLVVIVDEAHKFCPQENPKAASMEAREIISGCKEAMIALATTGRKRGFSPWWATQRLAKLDKDASAEFFNRLVGMTIEDVDVERAADLMGVSKDEKKEFRQALRSLEPGQFYAFGRAITIERKLVQVGGVETHHPQSGKQAAASAAPPMPGEVKRFLPQLADLPKEAEERARTEAEFKREIRELKAALAKRHLPASAPPPLYPKAEIERAAQNATKPFRTMLKQVKKQLGKTSGQLIAIGNELINWNWNDLPQAAPAATSPHVPQLVERPQRTPAPSVGMAPANGSGSLNTGQRAILLAIAQSDPASRSQITVLTGYRQTSRNEYIKILRAKGLIEERGEDRIYATQAGMAELGDSYEPLPIGGAALREYWLDRLSGGEREIFAFVLRYNGEAVDREEIGAGVAYKSTSRNEYIKKLQARKLLERGSGPVRPAAMLFDREATA